MRTEWDERLLRSLTTVVLAVAICLLARAALQGLGFDLWEFNSITWLLEKLR